MEDMEGKVKWSGNLSSGILGRIDTNNTTENS